MLCSLIPKFKLPFLSKFFESMPLKSLDLGKAINIKRPIKSYILFPLKVTDKPTFIPSLVLNPDIDFLAFLKIGFWPDNKLISLATFSTNLSSLSILPIPTLMTTLSTFGTAITLSIPNFFCMAGIISFLYCVNKSVMGKYYTSLLHFLQILTLLSPSTLKPNLVCLPHDLQTIATDDTLTALSLLTI